MSFYTCNRTGTCPGVMTGNPLNGLCEKACIQVDKVLDAALRQIQENNVQVTLCHLDPHNPATPLTFVSATTDGDTTISNLVVERLVDKPNFARVSFDATVPMLVSYVDANGVPGTGKTSLVIPNDIVLFVPQPSLVPHRIEVFGAVSSPVGSYVSGSTFCLTTCITLIIRVVVMSELCVPSYGYCSPPPAQDYTQEICSGTFDLPLFPTALQNQRL